MHKVSINIATIIVVTVIATTGVFAAGNSVKPEKQNWSFSGLFGTFDRGALQRGFQVYNEVCAACHSARLLHYRNLKEIGFSEDQVKSIAASKEVTDGPNAEGEMFQRPARLSDRLVKPFPNDEAARAGNNGALPPDLTLMTKARVGGADYLHALLIGYKPSPKNVKLGEGMYYNLYFPGQQIAMPPPLVEGGVEYADKTKSTVDQMSRDLTTFLTWAAEPELEWRKRMGVKVILFLLILTGMLYGIKRKVWSDLH
jgi:ubiquinol-cytochrome c reductase cytochrome c1 subunit